jgi:hypothetical protein
MSYGTEMDVERSGKVLFKSKFDSKLQKNQEQLKSK